MGYFKELKIEMEELWSKGYVIPKRGTRILCSHHFENKYLNHYIEKNGHDGICSYCGRRNQAIDLADFVEYVGYRLKDFLSPIEDECLPLVSSFYDDNDEVIPGLVRRGDFVVPYDAEYYEDVNDLMENFQLVSNEDSLNDEIASCFHVNQWIRRNPTELLRKDELLILWKNFSMMVKTRCRFTFFRNEDYYRDCCGHEEYSSDIIADVCSMLVLTEETIHPNILLYRGRPEDDDAPFTTFESLTAPPTTVSKANRMSPNGVSMFYGSFDSSTPITEIYNYLDDNQKRIYVGTFKVKRPLKVVNLCSIPKPDFWMKGKDDWQRYAFLHKFHDEISQPIGCNDPEIEYIPSQVFSEYLRNNQKTKSGSHYDGIIYRSAMTEKNNIVLFYDNKTSSEILELVSVAIESQP